MENWRRRGKPDLGKRIQSHRELPVLSPQDRTEVGLIKEPKHWFDLNRKSEGEKGGGKRDGG